MATDTATDVPVTELPRASCTVTCTAGAMAEPAVAATGGTAKMSLVGGPARPVALNATGAMDVLPWTLADAVLVPDAVPRVQMVEASPAASVVDVVGATDPPPTVTDHTTATPGSGAPAMFTTFTLSGVGSDWPTVPVCPSPAFPASADGVRR